MPVLTADRVEETLRRGTSARLPDNSQPRFRRGERVVARNINPATHTRVPRYLRGRVGTIERCHGVFIFPDAHAHDGTKEPQQLYSVRFEAAELWGPDAPVATDAVYVDLFEPYLAPAP